MKYLLAVACFCHLSLFSSNSDPFSEKRLDTFYETFLCEEKNTLSEAGLTSVCTAVTTPVPGGGVKPLPDPPAPVPVPTPPAPPTMSNFLPIVLVNNSGLPDSEVFILLQGREYQVGGGGPQIFMQFDTSTGVGTQVPVTTGDNGMTYTIALSQLTGTNPAPHTYYVYVPPNTDSFLVLISLQSKLNIPVLSTGIADPAFDNPNDPYGNFNIIWDQFEGAYVPTTPNVNVDATAVSFFSIPLYIYLSTPSAPSGSNCGLTQSRNSLMAYMQSALSTVPPAPENAQWSKLVLKNGSTYLRVLSTGKAMPQGYFDNNYLDNASAYGYSYLSDIWYGAMGFYKTNTLSIEIPGGAVYSGNAVGNNTIVLHSGPNQVTLGPVSKAPPYTASTSFDIFSGLNIASSATIPADGIQVSKAFQEAIIAGIVPTTSLINASLLTTLSVFRPYYQINPNLSSAGKTTGPWYDLYSAALHNCGLIYTFAYDEPLWPEVLLASNTLLPGTYIGVTIGNTQ